MAQTTPVVPTTGIVSGLAMANSINAAMATLNTCWLGSSAPSDAPNGIPANGQMWVDTSVAGYQLLKRYEGAAWVIEAVIDTTNDLLLNPIGGGSATIASAATTNLGSKYESYQTISGTTTITSFGSSVPNGQVKVLTFSGSLTLTHNGTSLILPGSANIQTAAGDVAIMQSLGSGNWKCLFYGRFSGAQLSMTGASNTVASATTTDLAAAGSNSVLITGTTTITSFGSNATLANPIFFVRFIANLVLTYNATSLIIPGGTNINTAAGDTMIVEYLGSGNWRVLNYQRANGTTISSTGGITSIASAASTSIGNAGSNNVAISGNTTITSLGSAGFTCNPIYFVRFTGILTLTHNGTSLILPGSANITTANGDSAIFEYLGSGNWRCRQYMRINGTAVVASTAAKGAAVYTTGSGNFVTAGDVTSTTQFKFTLTGGGGGGGGCSNGGAAGGGAGSTAIYYVTGLSAAQSCAYSIGAAGAAGTSAPGNGGAGGNTTVTVGATTVTAPGGAGGALASGAGNTTPGSGGGACTNATLSIPGGGGQAGCYQGNASGGGIGGASFWGGGGKTARNSAGQDGQAYGSGGSGAENSGTAAGGAGASGVMTVEWW